MRSSTSSARRRRAASASVVPASVRQRHRDHRPDHVARDLECRAPAFRQHAGGLPGQAVHVLRRRHRSPIRAAGQCPRAPPDSWSGRRWRCARTRRGSLCRGPRTPPGRGRSTAARAPPTESRIREARAPICAGLRHTSRRQATGCRAAASRGRARRPPAPERRARGTRPRRPPRAARAPSAR